MVVERETARRDLPSAVEARFATVCPGRSGPGQEHPRPCYRDFRPSVTGLQTFLLHITHAVAIGTPTDSIIQIRRVRGEVPRKVPSKADLRD